MLESKVLLLRDRGFIIDVKWVGYNEIFESSGKTYTVPPVLIRLLTIDLADGVLRPEIFFDIGIEDRRFSIHIRVNGISKVVPINRIRVLVFLPMMIILLLKERWSLGTRGRTQNLGERFRLNLVF
jgi:hypothetical protein